CNFEGDRIHDVIPTAVNLSARTEHLSQMSLKTLIYSIIRGALEFNQSIKKRFQKEFFYDNDNQIENFLGRVIETPASKVLNEIVHENNLNFSPEARSKLLPFIASLLCRTPMALQETDSMRNSTLNQVVREVLRLNSLDEEMAEEGKFIFEDRDTISLAALNGAEKWISLNDLALAFVFNKSSLDFYISDHPVFAYNWLYRKFSHPEASSMFATGLQIFFPVSYNLTLCLYDSEIYRYGRRDSMIIEIESDDVEILNSFQVSSAKSSVGFRSSSSVSNLKQLYGKYGNRTIHKWETSVLSRHNDGDGQNITRTLTVRRQLELKRMPSFVHSRKIGRKKANVCSLRNPLLAQAFYERERKNYESEH
ncbi:MAG: DUF4238 domain-containing protein, partial [Leptolyngbyaceae cyanobacterium CSU_1_4]|nr:DUF4238 domain-containing protein [Leptolyngbyaceae cyanobacterium CSU_1_4]